VVRGIARRWELAGSVVRFARGAPLLWKATRIENGKDREMRGTLASRGEQIDAYFARCPDTPRKLQIGAGHNLLSGWLNTDIEVQSSGVVFLDAQQPFPFEDQAFDYVFSEHVIEHMPYKGGLFMVRECFRVLKPGGTVRIGTPDAQRVSSLLSEVKSEAGRQYIRWSASDHLGLYGDGRSALQLRRPEWDIDPVHIRRCFPNVTEDCACFVVNSLFRAYGHQFLYDFKTLSALLIEAGFSGLSRCAPGESAHTDLVEIDSHGTRIGTDANLFETMVVEGTKPGPRSARTAVDTVRT